MTTAHLEQTLAELDAQKAEAREQEKQLLAELQAAQEAEHDEMVRAYWADRAAADPDDPEVLRARADLIARDRGAANAGTVAAAQTASVKGQAS